MRRKRTSLLLLIGVVLGIQGPLPAMAQDTTDHFKGKTIKIVIPTGPGGAYGLYGLLVAQHLGRHVPGNPAVTPEYRSGAGGIVASNYLYAVAPKDGTVIGIPLAPFLLAQFNGSPNVNYDAAKFNWIGQIGSITRLFAVWSTSSIKTFGDLTKQEIAVGSTGRGSETYMNPALINSVFGAKTRIIGGYKGSRDLMLAMERGEIGGATSTWGNFAGNHQDWMRDGKIRFIVQIGLSKVPQVGNVPLLQDLAKRDEDKRLIEFMSLVTTAVGYSLLTPPEVPGPVVATLRKAFDATMKDPAFLADAKKRNIDIDPAGHESLAAAVAKASQSPKALVQRFNEAIK